MTKFTLIATILISMFCVTAAKADSTLKELDAANKAFASAVMAGNVDFLVDEYTDDGCIIAPMAGETCGKEAIRAFWKAVIATKPKKVEIITEKAGRDGKLAFATGQLLLTDAESVVHKSRFTLVFKKVRGKWKLQVDSWNPQS